MVTLETLKLTPHDVVKHGKHIVRATPYSPFLKFYFRAFVYFASTLT